MALSREAGSESKRKEVKRREIEDVRIHGCNSGADTAANRELEMEVYAEKVKIVMLLH